MRRDIKKIFTNQTIIVCVKIIFVMRCGAVDSIISTSLRCALS
jgi:hypothetical protein